MWLYWLCIVKGYYMTYREIIVSNYLLDIRSRRCAYNGTWDIMHSDNIHNCLDTIINRCFGDAGDLLTQQPGPPQQELRRARPASRRSA